MNVRKNTLALAHLELRQIYLAFIFWTALSVVGGCIPHAPIRATQHSVATKSQIPDFQMFVSPQLMTAVCGDKIPISAFFKNSSGVKCSYGVSWGDRLPDCGMMEVDENGLPLKGDTSSFDNAGEGSGTFDWILPHSTYLEQIDVSQLYKFSEPSVRFFKVGLQIFDGKKQIMIWSSPVKIISYSSPVLRWQIFPDPQK